LVVRAVDIVSAGLTFVEPTLQVEVVAPDQSHGLGSTPLTLGSIGDATLLYTAPQPGTYYLRVTGVNVASDLISLVYSSISNPGMDRKDLWFSTSNDAGNSWSTPALLGFEQQPGFDVANPKLVVANDGCPYLFWQDWIRDTLGRYMSVRGTRARDGGDIWETP